MFSGYLSTKSAHSAACAKCGQGAGGRQTPDPNRNKKTAPISFLLVPTKGSLLIALVQSRAVFVARCARYRQPSTAQARIGWVPPTNIFPPGPHASALRASPHPTLRVGSGGCRPPAPPAALRASC